jgi:NAD+ synthase (glutamine-hydrolysing)
MLTVVLAQLNPIIGDFSGNLDRMDEVLKEAHAVKTDLVVFPELAICGYPPRDLLEKKDFLRQADHALSRVLALSEKYSGTAVVLGTVRPSGKDTGKGLYNCALLISGGEVFFQQNKMLLPTYDVFDEARYFDPSPGVRTFAYKNVRLGITICEDAWNDPRLFPKNLYTRNPVQELAELGTDLMINISASPFTMGKPEIRYQLFHNHARSFGIPFILVNQAGGNDELIFDGNSMVVGPEGLMARLPSFRESSARVDLGNPPSPIQFEPDDPVGSVYQALVLGLKDYMAKCGFKKAVMGLSGGIDSTLTACLAADAVGPDNVLGVAMPSPYSSKESLEDARVLAGNLGIQFQIIPISSLYHAYKETLRPLFMDRDDDVTEENIQARIRGNLLMALSNKFGHLTLSPGNKSELSVGYCTLYGDMSGGLGVLADVPKTLVYELARFRNREHAVIPERIFEKAPSAELKPDQTDQDSLPPYDVLDRILEMYLDQGLSREEMTGSGADPETVDWVISAVEKNEYKRRQAAPGLKVTGKAFGSGRRMPIAAKYGKF